MSVKEPKIKGLDVGLIGHVQRLNKLLEFLRFHRLREAVSDYILC